MTEFKGLTGNLFENELMSKHTSWRVGGAARRVYQPKNVGDLAVFMSQLADEEPILWVGFGSNLLVRDGGFPGTVILTAGTLQDLKIDQQHVDVEVGVSCGKLARQCARAGLFGTTFLAGIPGNFGGALAMNAGAHRSETWPLISAVTTIDRSGALHQRPVTDFEVSYRHVVSPADEWFVAATMDLDLGDETVELAEIKALLKLRNSSQPANQPCAGSVFRNPEGDFSGRLIEVSDLKGLTIGGASVSDKHANFIVNTGNATAQDIEDLINLVQQKVEQKQGVNLIQEVKIVGVAKG